MEIKDVEVLRFGVTDSNGLHISKDANMVLNESGCIHKEFWDEEVVGQFRNLRRVGDSVLCDVLLYDHKTTEKTEHVSVAPAFLTHFTKVIDDKTHTAEKFEVMYLALTPNPSDDFVRGNLKK